jgi:hypothetical protein
MNKKEYTQQDFAYMEKQISNLIVYINKLESKIRILESRLSSVESNVRTK